jgi:glycine/D-amino acid oxidase-like deaminating enzyme
MTVEPGRMQPTRKAEILDVVIVGAGIVGAACARACALAGLKTLVVEQTMVGGGATAAGMGHIVVMDDSPAQWALTQYARELWRLMQAELPLAAEYRETGTIWVAADDEEMAEVERKQRFLADHEVAGEVLSAEALQQAEPALRAGLAGGLYVPQDAVLYPPTVAEALLAAAERLGAERLYAMVTRAGDGEVVLQDGRRLRARAIVLATGTALDLLERVGGDCADLPLVRKRKGHLLITDRYPGLVRHQLVELGYLKSAHASTADSVACNVQPRATGQLLIGSSRQFGDEDLDVRPELLARMMARATEYLPVLAGLSSVRVWTGFRAATEDKLPLIGLASPRDASLYLATGHEGLGITTSLATAELLVDQIVGRPSKIAPEPYLPSRFVRQVAHA